MKIKASIYLKGGARIDVKCTEFTVKHDSELHITGYSYKNLNRRLFFIDADQIAAVVAK